MIRDNELIPLIVTFQLAQEAEFSSALYYCLWSQLKHGKTVITNFSI
jgi:hypothetical protein